MAQYNTLNVICIIRKSGIKNGNEVTLNLLSNTIGNSKELLIFCISYY